MEAVLVSHSHWDREWYRTFQDFRARLVDLVDVVLDLCDADPGYRFLLDGQTVVLEDYLEIRPGNAGRLRALCAAGRIALGPWYVQPDSLLPSGEAHVRNLLIGRRVGEALGPVSRAGYTPDSFGHPAQLPQILAGFGIGSFLYWRGNGNEIDALPAEYDWEAPDGSRVLACHLGRGYFAAATAPGADLGEAATAIARRAKELAERSDSGAILLLNGIDHALPEARTGDLARALSRATGFAVERGLPDDFVARVMRREGDRPRFAGELVGGRVAPLLPGVWSTRTWIKLANRRAESVLEGWAEPFAALARAFGLPDESPALLLAWKELLKNQAHDSICGCSRDEVHEQMRARFDTARELGEQTATRCIERLAGKDARREAPWSHAFDLVVANPSPRRRSDLVRFPLDFHPYLVPTPNPADGIHPTLLGDLRSMGFTVDGVPARLVPAETGRLKLVPERAAFDLEFVARDVPALGMRRVRVERAPDAEGAAEEIEAVAPGSEAARIAAGDVSVQLCEDGRFDVELSGRRFEGLGALESLGDRGDTYDHDPVTEGPEALLASVRAERRRHPGGVQELRVLRQWMIPARLDRDRRRRSDERAGLEVETVLRVMPGVPRVDLELRVDNPARDHRLRLLFPVRLPQPPGFDAATTFDVARRTPGPADDTGWVQRAPATFPHQGFVHAGGLCVAAPGLPEAEVIGGATPAIAVTLLRCVGSLSHPDLTTRPGPAGPGTDTPGAQCPGVLTARLSLLAGLDPAAAREAELGLRAFACAERTLAPEGRDLLAIESEPPGVLLSALKPGEAEGTLVLRLLNPGDAPLRARLRPGFPWRDAQAVRLDEEPTDLALERNGDALCIEVPGHALRSLALRV